MSVLSLTPTMFLFSERTMWRFGSSYDVFVCLCFIFLVWRTCSHRKPEPYHWLGRMVHLCYQDCWDSLLSFCTAGLPLPILIQLDPFTRKQRDLKSKSIVKFPYLLYVTIICVILPIVVCCINADTAVLVGTLFILGDHLEGISIYLVLLESQYSRRWWPSQQPEVFIFSCVIQKSDYPGCSLP
jgi:hypothetical protein